MANETLSSNEPVAVTDAAMSIHRFASPITTEDNFADFPTEKGEVDLCRLKELAEESAHKRGTMAKNKKQVKKGREHDPEVVAERVLDLLTMSRYRRGPVQFVQDGQQEFMERITHAVRNDEPIRLIASFFGSKVQNPVKTWASNGTEVDISEVASVLRFYEIASAIKVIYPRGAEFHISCDGRKYADSIGFSPKAGRGYYENIVRIAEHIQVQDTVCLFDEADHFPSDMEERKMFHFQRVELLYKKGQPDIVQRVTQLRASMCLSMPIDPTIDRQTVRAAFSISLDDPTIAKKHPQAVELRRSIYDASLLCALRYIAHYDAVKEARVVEDAVRNAVRTTVHPKPKQIGIYAINQHASSVFPHHGQGITKCLSLKPELDDIRIGFRADIERTTGVQLIALVLPTDICRFASDRHPFMFVSAHD
ncbi:hypothetical protein COW95_04065 [Candidatus Peregrinibacteria bacterium CG22_combo_CG10-13_8_21_14_all_49_11]|nr:MAG: hypothetical protein COW95_04065 [Candidatus Peregrinibacteria bacterium CG22_combo_CG10-13_8_21_14_all_49_11]